MPHTTSSCAPGLPSGGMFPTSDAVSSPPPLLRRRPSAAQDEAQAVPEAMSLTRQRQCGEVLFTFWGGPVYLLGWSFLLVGWSFLVFAVVLFTFVVALFTCGVVLSRARGRDCQGAGDWSEIDDVKGVDSADRVVLRLERPAWASLPGGTSVACSLPGLGEDGAGHGFVLATVVVEADVVVAKLLHRA